MCVCVDCHYWHPRKVASGPKARTFISHASLVRVCESKVLT